MIATVVSVDPYAKAVSRAGKPYNYTALHVQTDKGPKEVKLFGAGVLVDTAMRLNEGTRVNLKYDTSGKFPELVAIEPVAETSPQYNGDSGGNGDVQASIARSVALKAAVDFMQTSENAYAAVPDVIRIARLFEEYLHGNDVDFCPESKLPTIDENDDLPF